MFSRPSHLPLPSKTTAAVWRSISGIVRCFSWRTALSAKQMPPRPKLDESEFTKIYLKGSGPGGQKINKTNSAVQLIHKTTGLVVKSQATRSRSQNLKLATQLLADKLDQMHNGERSRAAIVAGVKARKKASRAKKSRRKYRALEEEEEEERKGERSEGGEALDGEEGEGEEERGAEEVRERKRDEGA